MAPPRPDQHSGAVDVNLFCYRDGVVDLDAEISDRTFDLGVPQMELDGSQIAGSPAI